MTPQVINAFHSLKYMNNANLNLELFILLIHTFLTSCLHN